MPDIAINTRNLFTPLTGVQRYTQELMQRMAPCRGLSDARFAGGAKGHLWEQWRLPGLLHDGEMLWSPSNTGPLSVSRQVVTIHDAVPFDHPEWLSPAFAHWYRFLLPRLAARVRGIITISEFSKQRLLRALPVDASRIQVIHNGVDARFKPQPAAAVAAALSQYGCPSEHYVLSVGSLEPRKNIAGLLKAWLLIADQLPGDCWLYLAGGRGNARIFADAGINLAGVPRVKWLGRVADAELPALYAGARAFVYPSFYEGFGLPPIEAMACGTTVISGSCPVFAEVLGDVALQVNPHEAAAIGEAILRVVDDAGLAAGLRQRGLAHAARFRWDVCARETQRYIEACAR